MVEAAHLGRVGEDPALPVEEDRVVVPRIPVAQHHLHELVGAVVAFVVRDRRLGAVIRSLGIIERGDDVPGRPSAAHVVEGREGAGDVERRVIGGRAGGAEADPPGRRGHDRQYRNRVHLHHPHAVPHRVRVGTAIDIRQCQPVVEEGEMELAGLQDLGDPPVVAGGEEVAGRFRVAPGGGVVGAVLRLEEAHQDHAPLAHAVLRRRAAVICTGPPRRATRRPGS